MKRHFFIDFGGIGYSLAELLRPNCIIKCRFVPNGLQLWKMEG